MRSTPHRPTPVPTPPPLSLAAWPGSLFSAEGVADQGWRPGQFGCDHLLVRPLRAKGALGLRAPKAGNLIPDERLLELLLDLDVLCESAIDRSRAAYDAASPPGVDEPSLETLRSARPRHESLSKLTVLNLLWLR